MAPVAFEDLLRDWDGEFLASRYAPAEDAWLLAGVHSTALGPGFGGTRLKVYPDPTAAVADVLRLSRAMTFKNAVAALPFGGGKAVLAVPSIPEGDRRRALLDTYGDLLVSLGGCYVTACDMNTTERDMDVLADRSPDVMGTSEQRGGSGTSAPDTARGVHQGIRAALRHVTGTDDPAGRSVVVQGAGAVGARLVELLADDGAAVVVADVDPARAEAAAARPGVTTVPAGREYDLDCDVFAPCATGGVLNAATIERLRCRIVAGAANNQLADPDDDERLAAAGILYAPDYVVNAGGVLHLAGYERLGWSADEMAARLAGIGDTLRGVLDTAEAEGITPAEAADRLAIARLNAAPH
jgi:glutamate dehydrogenase/leucine dehydrogenase